MVNLPFFPILLNYAVSAGGNITVHYGFHNQSTGDTVYTRQVFVPVMLTVRKALDIVEIDALAFRPGLMMLEQEHGFADLVKRVGSTEGVGKRCLLAVDVRNTWSCTLTLIFQIKHDEDERDIESTYQVEPGATARVMLPIKQLLLSSEYVTQPIPMAANKQFVLSKSHKSNPAAEELSRKLFWYKEAILEKFSAQWLCVSAPRLVAY